VKPAAITILLTALPLPVYKDPHKHTTIEPTNVPNAHSYSILLLTAVGNRRFRILVDLNMQKYKDAKFKIEKSLIVVSIVDAIREASVIGGFVKKVRLFLVLPRLACFLRPFATPNFWRVSRILPLTPSRARIFLYRLTLQDPSSQRWHEVPDAIAREKVGQQIRETLAKTNPLKCEARKVQRKTKAKRPRLISATPISMVSSSSAVSMSSSAASFSSAGEEMDCSGTADWGNNEAIDTDDTTPLQVDFSTLNANSNYSISISPPPPPSSPPKGFDSPIAFVQSGKFLHKDMNVPQLVPDWQNQQGRAWSYEEV
jgi:hypothetical protein